MSLQPVVIAFTADFEHRARKTLQEAIKAHGVAYTGEVPGLKHKVGWIYTVGLTMVGHPEIVIPDMPPRTAVHWAGETIAAIARRELTLADGQTLMLHGQRWTVRRSMPKASLYGVPKAMTMYGDRKAVRAYTLVAPEHVAIKPGTIWHGSGCGCCPSGPTEQALFRIAEPTRNIGSVSIPAW